MFPDLLPGCRLLSMKLDLRVIVAALSGDYKQQLFPAVAEALPYASRIRQLYARCDDCGSPRACFSVLRRPCPPIPANTGIILGSSDVFSVLCPVCFARQTTANISLKEA